MKLLTTRAISMSLASQQPHMFCFLRHQTFNQWYFRNFEAKTMLNVCKFKNHHTEEKTSS